ncbi:hypothetical protein FOYG_17634 [Fusarium oxysporum NRRL 32931]|uniref:Uncharacterized protein n=1 Tax=Fusarium oxysporum NRRL 32931 TaxID=660029 RepID=W9HDW2_FUSOX|nr:hypothetical protein FOYG_17634 [Fusarium oxysporum NRRL 32931]
MQREQCRKLAPQKTGSLGSRDVPKATKRTLAFSKTLGRHLLGTSTLQSHQQVREMLIGLRGLGCSALPSRNSGNRLEEPSERNFAVLLTAQQRSTVFSRSFQRT